MDALVWDAPAGFHLFQLGGDDAGWVEGVVAETPGGTSHRDALRAELAEFVAWCRAQGDAPVWVAGVASGAGDRPYVCVTGRIDVGPLVDVDEVAASWRAGTGTHPHSKRVVVSPSHRAPVVAGRQVFLHTDSTGRETYRETGAAVMALPRIDTSVRLELTTHDLIAFDDLVDFLTETVRDISLIEEPEHART